MLTIETTDRNREDLSDMGREQMRNLEISKIGATQVNEFEYQKHQGEMTEQEHPGQQGSGGKRLTQAERVAQVMAAAHRKVEKKRKKEGARTGSKKSSAAKQKAKK
jgi:hypothetical protein